jgi:hypothetical protein
MTEYNPFAVQTPEGVSAEDVVSLFVDVFTDFYHIPRPGHTFLHGPRGSGKSMMFRYLEPDCQSLVHDCTLRDLPFYGVYVPIKNTDLKITELSRLHNKHADFVLNEHMMTTYIAVKLVSSMTKSRIDGPERQIGRELREFYYDSFFSLLARAGRSEPLPDVDKAAKLPDYVAAMKTALEQLYSEILGYLRRLSFAGDSPIPYSGGLTGYLDFFLPLASRLRKLSFMPQRPIYLLVDDADNLNGTQTRILNSWVSSRTSADVSLKISTQLNYKTFRTINGQTIDAPHDFSEINISSIYTSSKHKYKERIREIVAKRLAKAGIDAAPEEFFPLNKEQEEKIKAIGEELRNKWTTEGRGYRPSDDVVRYARPTYIASLKGTSKSAHSYSYSGFDQLVHISSGIVRYFLEAASQMFGEEAAVHRTEGVRCIPHAVQNSVVREQADKFIFSEFDKILKDEEFNAPLLERATKLRNLIFALGGLFHAILVSNASERRVFSLAFSDVPDQEIMDVFQLGIQYGYFHESAIGNKEGTGRTRLFVLSRRLAPYFLLDPTSFAGYKFVRSQVIHEAMRKPQAFLRRVKSGLSDNDLEDLQLELF